MWSLSTLSDDVPSLQSSDERRRMHHEQTMSCSDEIPTRCG